MDFQLSEDQRAIAEMAGSLFADLCTDDRLRAFDTSGEALFKRGYRVVDVVAPIVDKRQRGDNLDFTVEIPVGFDRYCIEIIALQQPAAHDLRFVISVAKITPVLERIADHAGSIAQCGIGGRRWGHRPGTHDQEYTRNRPPQANGRGSQHCTQGTDAPDPPSRRQ